MNKIHGRRLLRRRLLIIAAIALIAATAAGLLTATQAPAEPGPDLLVFAQADVISTTRWIRYLSAHGFRVRVRYDPYVRLVHEYLRVPKALQSVHTALVDGYIIEGNVPAEDIRRLLAERPHARGLAVPGMPDLAPGMQGLGGQPGPYPVLLFGDDGPLGVFAVHGSATGSAENSRHAANRDTPHTPSSSRCQPC
ncbi:DUF411 domain-containing protein [Solimonas terrae]|uniref:DUF411 domain-containing protein n=1 Tax=Solimonas terrae TaxID=1396819 RepID=A0A6M2BWM1_9GAMM|nr:DUF411 domain-containing protein [Solimonas terrae]NGY06369.1 DUF411 domain-containing protein [Solimonas terrae]